MSHRTIFRDINGAYAVLDPLDIIRIDVTERLAIEITYIKNGVKDVALIPGTMDAVLKALGFEAAKRIVGPDVPRDG
jgi:hypothetical protein